MFEVVVLDIKKSSVLFNDHASMVVLPGEEGEITVLDFHQALISTLKNGILRIDNIKMSIKNGIAGVKENALTILVEKA